MWRAAIMPQSEIPAMDIPGGTEESYEKIKLVNVPARFKPWFTFFGVL
jgi:hypothetical protein